VYVKIKSFCPFLFPRRCPKPPRILWNLLCSLTNVHSSHSYWTDVQMSCQWLLICTVWSKI